jgi:hypothetical protein
MLLDIDKEKLASQMVAGIVSGIDLEPIIKETTEIVRAAITEVFREAAVAAIFNFQKGSKYYSSDDENRIKREIREKAFGAVPVEEELSEEEAEAVEYGENKEPGDLL